MRARWWWIGVAAGVAMMAFGVIGAFRHADATRPTHLLTWTLGAAVFHDALLAPCALAIGTATARWVPARVRVPVRVGLALSALVTAMAWPYVRGFGRRASNPSALPFHYARNLVIVLAAIWVSVVAATVVSRFVRSRAA